MPPDAAKTCVLLQAALRLHPMSTSTHVDGCHALCARVRMEARSNLKPSTWYSLTQ